MLRAWPKSKFVRYGIAVLYVIAVLFLAIASRQPGETAGLNMQPFLALKRAIVLKGPSIFSGIRIRSKIMLMDIILNLLLFVPFGFIVPCFSKKLAHWWAVMPMALCFSSFIEFTQFTAQLGTADVDDLINNTIGAFIGWVLYMIVLKKKMTERKKRR